MRLTARRFVVPVLAALVALAALHSPAAAKNQLMHFKFQRALAAQPLDSVLVTLSTTSFDTLQAIGNSNVDPTAVAALDTNITGTAVAAIAHVPLGSMALVVEVTGALQSQDSLYVGMQLSQGPTRETDGSTGNSAGNQSDPYNWRWYNAILTSAGGTLVNSAGTQTFVFLVPCSVASPNAYVWATQQRFIIQGDTNAAAKAFSTRAWLVTRDRP